MPLNIPDSAAEIVQRAKVAVQRALPGSNPFLKNSWLGALITGLATRIYDFYLQLQQVGNFYQTNGSLSLAFGQK